MTLPATNTNFALHGSTPPAEKRDTGWDPFEVWRTRVLLPRLAETRGDEAPTGTPVTPPSVKLVRP